GRRHQQTQRGGDTGRRRTDHLAYAELASDVAGVDGPGAAGAEERRVARVAAALRDVHAGGARHRFVDDVVDAPRHVDERELDPAGEPGDRRAGRRDVDRDRPAREVRRVQVAEQQVGIGDGRLRAAEAVADRTGQRAGAPRADLQEADLVELRDRPAAGADLDQLDGGDTHGQAAALDEPLLARRLEAVGGERLAADDQRE